DVTNSIKKMLANGHKVILIYPVPVLNSDVPKLLLKYRQNRGDILPEAGSILHADFNSRAEVAEFALDAVGEHRYLTRIHPEDLLCDTILKDRCAAHVDGKPLYSDNNHLSKYGAELVLKKVIEHL